MNIGRTRTFVVVQGTIGGLAGMAHGIFAIMLGNKPAGGFILDPATGAFTLLPTYLSSGIAAVCAGLALILWTIVFIHRKSGPSVFLTLCVVLFLVGGGIAQVGFFLIAWAVSLRINHPPNFWKSDDSGSTRRRWAGAWPAFFGAGYLFLGVGIAIWLLYTPPGTPYSGHSAAYLACWFALATGLIFQLLTIVAGFAQDIDRS